MSEFSLEPEIVGRKAKRPGNESDYVRQAPDRGAGPRTQAQIDRSMVAMFGGVTPDHAVAREQVAAEDREVQGKGFFGRLGTRFKQGLLGLGLGKLFGRKRGEDEEPADKPAKAHGQKMGWMQRLFGARRSGGALPFGSSVGKKPGWADRLVDADQAGNLPGRRQESDWFEEQAAVSGEQSPTVKDRSQESYAGTQKPEHDEDEGYAHLLQIPQRDLLGWREPEMGGDQFSDRSSEAVSESSIDDADNDVDDDMNPQNVFRKYMMQKVGQRRMS